MQEIQACLRQDIPWLTRTLAGALAMQGKRMPLEELRVLLHQPHKEARVAALEALAGAGAAAPLDEIIEVYQTVPEVRAEALTTLCRLAEYVPLAFFLSFLQKKRVRTSDLVQMLRAIKQKGGSIPLAFLPQLASTLSGDPNTALAAFVISLDEITEMAPADLAQLLATIRPLHFKDEEAARLQPIFARLVPQVPLAIWLDLLKSQQDRLREGTLHLLALHPERPSRKAVVAALFDKNGCVCKAALQALQDLGLPLRRRELLRCLKTARWDVSGAIINALATLGKNAPLKVITAELNESNHWMRAVAVRALGQPGLLERTPVELLRHMAGDPFPAVRAVALPVLARKDPQAAVAASLNEVGLLEAWSYNNRESFLVAWSILQEFASERLPAIYAEAARILTGGQPGTFFVSQSLSFLADVLGAMGHLQPAFLTRLGQLLHSPNWEVRLKAAQALGKRRCTLPDSTIRRLMELRHDPDSRAVRKAADEALREMVLLENGMEDA